MRAIHHTLYAIHFGVVYGVKLLVAKTESIDIIMSFRTVAFLFATTRASLAFTVAPQSVSVALPSVFGVAAISRIGEWIHPSASLQPAAFDGPIFKVKRWSFAREIRLFVE